MNEPSNKWRVDTLSLSRSRSLPLVIFPMGIISLFQVFFTSMISLRVYELGCYQQGYHYFNDILVWLSVSSSPISFFLFFASIFLSLSFFESFQLNQSVNFLPLVHISSHINFSLVYHFQSPLQYEPILCSFHFFLPYCVCVALSRCFCFPFFHILVSLFLLGLFHTYYIDLILSFSNDVINLLVESNYSSTW